MTKHHHRHKGGTHLADDEKDQTDDTPQKPEQPTTTTTTTPVNLHEDPSKLSEEDSTTPLLPSLDHVQQTYRAGGISAVYRVYCNIIESAVNRMLGYKFREIGNHPTAMNQNDFVKRFLRRFILPTTTANEFLTNHHSALLQSLTTMFLTTTTMSAICIGLIFPNAWRLCTWLVFLSTFHLLEYFCLCVYHPEDQSYNHFALHMKGFAWIRGLSCVEFIAWSLALKKYSQLAHSPFFTAISIIGAMIMCIGQIFRSLSILNLGVNFQYTLLRRTTHDEKKNALITTGVHRYVRHPSYSSMMFYFFGQSLLLLAPIGFITGICFGPPLMAARVEEEEKFLVEMYPEAYPKYCATTPAFIPTVESIRNGVQDVVRGLKA